MAKSKLKPWEMAISLVLTKYEVAFMDWYAKVTGLSRVGLFRQAIHALHADVSKVNSDAPGIERPKL